MFEVYGSWFLAGEKTESAFFAVWVHSCSSSPRHEHEEQTAKLLERALGEHFARCSPGIGEWQGSGVAMKPEPGTAERFLAALARVDSAIAGFSGGAVNAAGLLPWIEAAKLVLAVIAEGMYLPFIKLDALERQYAANWQPLLDAPLISRQLHLIQQRIEEAGELDRSAPAGRSKERLAGFVDAWLDRFVRDSIRDHDIQQVRDSAGFKYGVSFTPVEHWLSGLLAQEPEADPQIEWLYDDMSDWREKVAQHTARTTFRLSLRLTEPELSLESAGQGENNLASAAVESDAPRWTLQFWLEAEGEPDLQVPARAVWQCVESQLSIADIAVAAPQEKLLAELGRAAEIFTPLGRSLSAAGPEECLLTTEEASFFLRWSAQQLSDSGFGVRIPAWAGDESGKLGLSLQMADRTLNRTGERRTEPWGDSFPGFTGKEGGWLGLHSLVDYRWSAVLGGEAIAREELEQLAALKMPLVRFRGRWVEFDPSKVPSLLRFLENGQTGTFGRVDALQAALAMKGGTTDTYRIMDGWGMSEGALPVPVKQVSASEELETVLHRLQNLEGLRIAEQPEGLRGQLRPYQRRGAAWLHELHELGFGACLADDMGLGKTVQWIAYRLHAKETERSSYGPALLICPTSVLGNWQNELQRFAPELVVYSHYGANRIGGQDFTATAQAADIVLTTYGTAQRDADVLGNLLWDCITLDEAQNIKNTSAKQTQRIRHLPSVHRIALTGTPVENRLTELWSIMDFLNPGYLGSREQFRNRFIVPIEKNGDEERTNLLNLIISPFLLRRVKSDRRVIEDLPEKEESRVDCRLTVEQAALYEACVRQMLSRIEAADGMQRRGAILAAITHLKQICDHPALYLKEEELTAERSGKLTQLVEMTDKLMETGDRMLIFTQYARFAELLRSMLEKRYGQEAFLLTGSTGKNRRDEMVRAFQEAPDAPQIFVLSLKAGGYGLNLTRANHVFHYDRWWNPAVENQATDRVYRIGQQRHVQVHKLICPGTLEESIHQMMKDKEALADQVIGSGERWLTEMTTEQLKGIIALRHNDFREGAAQDGGT